MFFKTFLSFLSPKKHWSVAQFTKWTERNKKIQQTHITDEMILSSVTLYAAEHVQ